jgi:hypothetical protein
MPTFTLPFDNSDHLQVRGPVLNVHIGFDPMWDRYRNGYPQLPADLLPALVDTGASESSIVT